MEQELTQFSHSQGESEAIKELLRAGEKLIEEKDLTQLISWYLPMIIELSSTLKELEEFYGNGGIDHLCKIIMLYLSEGTSSITITPIVEEIQFLLSFLYPSYDDHIGDIPFLVYFLSERQNYYIEINWKQNTLSLMENFCEAHISLICNKNKKLKFSIQQFELTISNFYTSLLTYPPHRVTTGMAKCFNTYHLTKLMESILDFIYSGANSKTILKINVLLNSILSIGLGYTFLRETCICSLRINSNKALKFGIRCPCAFCEIPRRLNKLASMRDELGIEDASFSKRTIPTNFIHSGGISVLKALILEAITLQFQSVLDHEQFDTEDLDFAFKYFGWNLYLITSTEEFNTNQLKDEFNYKVFEILFLIIKATHHLCLLNENLAKKILSNSESGYNSLLIITTSLLLHDNFAIYHSNLRKTMYIQQILSLLCNHLTESENDLTGKSILSIISIISSLFLLFKRASNCIENFKAINTYPIANYIPHKINELIEIKENELFNKYEVKVNNNELNFESNEFELHLMDCCYFIYKTYFRLESVLASTERKTYIFFTLQFMLVLSSTCKTDLNVTELKLPTSSLDWLKCGSKELKGAFENEEQNADKCYIIHQYIQQIIRINI